MGCCAPANLCLATIQKYKVLLPSKVLWSKEAKQEDVLLEKDNSVLPGYQGFCRSKKKKSVIISGILKSVMGSKGISTLTFSVLKAVAL